MSWLRAVTSRVEQKIVLLVVLCGILPMGVISYVVLNEIESQTLILSERQLRESTKTYSLSLFDRIEQTVREVRLLHLGGLALKESELAREIASLDHAEAANRPVLRRIPDGFVTEARYGASKLRATISFVDLFESLGHLPVGVNRCVELRGEVLECAGDAEEGEHLEARWQLPIASVYETDVEIAVVSRQSKTSALGQLSLVSKVLPPALLLLATLISWLLIVLIRRRIAPLSELESATLAVRDGVFGARVHIETHDEFERLGDAFNLMAVELDESFEKFRSLAEIDRMVLDGGEFDEVVQQALQLANRYNRRRCVVYIWQEHQKQGRLYELKSGGLKTTDLCLISIDGKGRMAVDHREALSSILGIQVEQGFPIQIDGEVRGELLTANASVESNRSSTLEELADRISVAATNLARAKTLYQQANFDSLTGLINRHAFTDRLGEAIERAKRHDERGTIFFLDLDRFKQINDTRGHKVGDEVLRRVGQKIAGEMRSADIVSRLGGDEFAVIVPECGSNADIAALCSRIIASVSEPIQVDQYWHEVDVSLGVSIFPDDGADAGTLLMKADVAMYEAKSQAGSTYSFYASSLNEQNERRVLVESRLRAALKSGVLSLYYQPKLELSTMQVRGVEGLMRWRDEQGAIYNPDEFVPVAEETGLIHQFTELLVTECARCLEQCDTAGLEIGRIAINISTRQFARQGFARDFLQVIANSGLSPQQLEIEVTESLFINDAESVRGELAVLRSAGVHIALDDFGTGYSSLNMLRTLPLNTVKIDRSFIEPLRSSVDARNVTQKIIEMASVLNLSVVAEGVEHWQEVSLLERLGCDYVQGFVLEPAMPVEELVPYLLRLRREGITAEYRVIGSG